MLKGKFKYVLYRIVRKFRVINQGTTRKNKEIPEENDSNTLKIKAFEKLLNLSNSKYHMQPYPGDVFYIQSSDLLQRDFLKRNIKTWKKFVNGNMRVFTMEGNHFSFFYDAKHSNKLKTLITDILANTV